MAYDPRTIYRKLAELLGGTRGDPAQSRGEFYDVPGYGQVRTQPVNPSGWDTSEVWLTGAGGASEDQRYAAGEIPDWMRSGVGFMLGGAGKLSPEEMAALARHWVYGEGVDPGYQAAFNAQPQWVSDWLRAQFAPYLGTQAM